MATTATVNHSFGPLRPLPLASLKATMAQPTFLMLRVAPAKGGARGWMARATRFPATHPTVQERTLKLEYSKHYGSYAIKGHTRMYLTCELNDRLTLDRLWARSFEQWHLSFVRGPDGAERLILQSRRNKKYVVVSGGDMRALEATAEEPERATRFDVFAVDCVSEASCWGSDAAAQVDARDASLPNGPRARVPIFGSPKSLLRNDTGAVPHSARLIARRTLQNWAMLPGMQPLVLTRDPETEALVKALNDAGAAGGCAFRAITLGQDFEDQPKFKQPTYRGLFAAALRTFPDAPVVMYTNSDILYTSDLRDTISRVASFFDTAKATAPALRGFMIVGQRINIDFAASWSLAEPGCGAAPPDAKGQCPGRPLWSDALLRIAKTGAPFQNNAEDYFVVSRELFNWDDIPDFVVGGVAFDNWITNRAVRMAMEGRAIVVDGTKTVLAVHQNHGSGRKDSHKTPKSRYNSELAHSHGGTEMGHTYHAAHETWRLRTHAPPVVIEKYAILLH